MKQCTYVDTKYILYAVIVTVVVLGWYFDEGKLLCWCCRHEEEVLPYCIKPEIPHDTVL